MSYCVRFFHLTGMLESFINSFNTSRGLNQFNIPSAGGHPVYFPSNGFRELHFLSFLTPLTRERVGKKLKKKIAFFNTQI